MIEIRACTPDDAAAVSTLLSELGYTVPIRQASENIRALSKTGSDSIFVAVGDGRVVGFSQHTCVDVAICKSGCAR
jgi:predicted N-acetyltransferase YhbS